MTKKLFTKSLEAMRTFWLWTDDVEKAGMSFSDEKMELLNDTMLALLGDGRKDWAYDKEKGIDWIIEYTSNQHFSSDYSNYYGYGKSWHLKNAEDLYDFLMYMHHFKQNCEVVNVK